MRHSNMWHSWNYKPGIYQFQNQKFQQRRRIRWRCLFWYRHKYHRRDWIYMWHISMGMQYILHCFQRNQLYSHMCYQVGSEQHRLSMLYKWQCLRHHRQSRVWLDRGNTGIEGLHWDKIPLHICKMMRPNRRSILWQCRRRHRQLGLQ